MRLLALDIGRKRTGVAFVDTDQSTIVFPLDTLQHSGKKSLHAQVISLARERRVDALVLGLPLLLSGQEGEQVRFVRQVGAQIQHAGFNVLYQDERLTSPAHALADGDASAACTVLHLYLGSQGFSD